MFISFESFMKRNVFVLLLFSFFISCKEEEQLPNNGLSEEINNLVPEVVLNNMKNNGMPIFTGNTPPDLNGVYNISQVKIVGSNIPFDQINFVSEFAKFKLSNQNNSISLEYQDSDGESGESEECYISGTDCNFTVFASVFGSKNGNSAKGLLVLSGKIANNGLIDCHYA